MGKTKLQFIPLEKLTIDVNNPRIAHWLEMYKEDELTPEAIHMALGAGDSSTPSDSKTTFLSLKESIRSNEGIIFPIIVNKIDDNNYVVIEGNTRLAIYKNFNEKEPKSIWTEMPAIVHDNLPSDEIDAIRLQAHLVGPREWRPYAKAKYLNKLRNENHLTMRQIVDFCGGREAEVIRYIEAFNDMEQFYRPLCQDSNFDPTRFSAFIELQRNNVITALIENKFSKRDFAVWVKDRKFKRLETIRQLPNVLNDPKAKQIFLTKDINEAIKSLDTPTSTVDLKNANIYELAKALSYKISIMPHLEFLELQKIREHQSMSQSFP